MRPLVDLFTPILELLTVPQTALKHVSDYYMFYDSALVPWVHYVPFGEYDKDDILPVRSERHRRIAVIAHEKWPFCPSYRRPWST